MHFGTEEQFNEDFDKTFTDDIKELLENSVNRSYLSAREHYYPEQGSNNSTFGIDIYHFSCFEINRIADLSKGKIKIISNSPVFRIGIGKFELSNHKVGNLETDDIEYCFPNTDRASCPPREYFDANQLKIEYSELVRHVPEIHVPYNLVLAHIGNPITGFIGLYLCRPGKTENKKIKEWKFIKPICKRSGNFIINSVNNEESATEIVPIEIPFPKVVKKQKEKSDNG